MENNHHTLTLEFSSAEAAEDFINTVKEDEVLSSKVNFLLSSGHKLEYRKVRRAKNRPNETPLNIKAFFMVLSSGALLWLATGLFSSHYLPMFNPTFIAMGILVVTLAGAAAALGLPSRISSKEGFRKVKLDCDTSVEGSLLGLASKF